MGIIIIIITYLFECCEKKLTAFLADWNPQNEALGSMRRQLGPYPQVLKHNTLMHFRIGFLSRSYNSLATKIIT
jgi:hypothetical protein